jgi:hypothetical protein
LCLLDENLADFLLTHGMPTGFLADVDLLATVGSLAEQGGVDEVV